MKTNRKFDSSQEKIVNYFAHEYFFKKLDENSSMVEDVDMQVHGSDEVFNGKNVDLKAQSSKRYLNAPADTFILEVSFLDRRGKEHIGWFLNNESITDYYAFIWIPKVKVNDDGVITSPTDIEEMEILMVDKHDIRNFIQSKVSDNELLNIADDMRYYEDRRADLPEQVYGLHISHTPTLFEKPVVLVAKKWLLEKFSVGHYLVTKNSIKSL